MAESTLSLNFEDLRDAVYEFLFGGDGDHSGDSDSDRKALCDRMVYSGLRQFYKPPPIGGVVHDWNFLKPTTTLSIEAPYSSGTITYDHTGGANERQLTLASGTWPSWAASGMIAISGTDYEVDTRVSDSIITLTTENNPGSDVASGTTYELHQDDYSLPDDFGDLIGDFTFAQKDNAWYTCKLVGDNRLKELRQRGRYQNHSGGDPQFAAIRHVVFVEATGDRKEVMFWPTITSSATVFYQYRVRPEKPTAGTKYLYGGSDHSETILYSCLAEAERRLDDERGPMHAHFVELLATSVIVDGRDNKADFLGYNGDNSDGMPMHARRRQFLYSSSVSYKGL